MHRFENQPVCGVGSLRLQDEAQQLQGSLSEEGVFQHHVDHHRLGGKCGVMQEIFVIMTIMIIMW